MSPPFCTCDLPSPQRFEGIEVCDDCGHRILSTAEKAAITAAIDVKAVKRQLEKLGEVGADPGDASTNGAGDVALTVPAELIEQLAERAAELVIERIEVGKPAEEWIDAAAAAEHLSCGIDRIYSLTSAKRIPFQRDGSRLLFRRSALDEWLAAGGAKRP